MIKKKAGAKFFINDEERAFLDKLAAKAEITRSEIIRNLIKEVTQKEIPIFRPLDLLVDREDYKKFQKLARGKNLSLSGLFREVLKKQR